MNFRPELCRVTFCVTSFHEPGGPAILTNFPRKFVPDVRFLRDQLGTEETGWVVGGRGFRGERGRERERKRSVKQRHSGKVGRRYRAKHPEAGCLKLLTRLSNSGERRGGKAMAGQKSSFRGYFAPSMSISLSLFALSVSSFYALRLARKSVIFHDIFFATKKRRPLRVVAGRESFSCASEISNEKTLRREEGRIFRSLELILNRLLKI